jgi:hypothetical protein
VYGSVTKETLVQIDWRDDFSLLASKGGCAKKKSP